MTTWISKLAKEKLRLEAEKKAKDDEIARLRSQLENVDTTLRESLEACQVSKVSIISSQGWSQSLRVWR
jgi:predicted nuclease with TOPRIM domain